MGIGRREFLKLFGSTIATVAVAPLQAIVLADDLYINRALGVAFRKPVGWEFGSIKEFSRLKNSQILKDDSLSEIFDDAQEPLVVMSKGDPSEEIIGPSICVYVEEFAFEENETLLGLLPGMQAVYQRVLNDYQQIGSPIEHTISNCESMEFISEFLFETESVSAKARNRCLVSAREPQIYTVNMFDYPNEGLDAQKEYDEFLHSIYYV